MISNASDRRSDTINARHAHFLLNLAKGKKYKKTKTKESCSQYKVSITIAKNYAKKVFIATYFQTCFPQCLTVQKGKAQK